MSYIVYGETGEHADRQEWSVRFYRHKISAETHAELANRWCHEHGVSPIAYPRVTRDKMNPFDPNMVVDYTGVSYHIQEVEEGSTVELGRLEAEVWPV